MQIFECLKCGLSFNKFELDKRFFSLIYTSSKVYEVIKYEWKRNDRKVIAKQEKKIERKNEKKELFRKTHS